MCVHVCNREVSPSKKFFVDPTQQGNVARFLNHSCQPNIISVEVPTCQGARYDHKSEAIDGERSLPYILNLYSASEIYPGQELTIDYKWYLPDYTKDQRNKQITTEHAKLFKTIKCKCGAAQCRGYVR